MSYHYIVYLEVPGVLGVTEFHTKAKSPSQAMANAVTEYPNSSIVRVV